MQACNMETLFWFESKEEGSCYWYLVQVENKSTKKQEEVLLFRCWKVFLEVLTRQENVWIDLI